MVQIYGNCGALGNGVYSFVVDEVQNRQKFTLYSSCLTVNYPIMTKKKHRHKKSEEATNRLREKFHHRL